MDRRTTNLRETMSKMNLETCLMTSMHNIAYFSDFVYCSFGRHYGLVVGHEGPVKTISAGIDAGQPWRRTANGGENVTYTDWQRDNYFKVAVEELIRSSLFLLKYFTKINDHLTLDMFSKLRSALPDSVELVDISKDIMKSRMVKSAEEIELIRLGAWVADQGGESAVKAISDGIGEYEVALASTQRMVTEIAKHAPGNAELMDTWTWFQSGINTDGAHNPVTTRKLNCGDILSLNCFPMIGGYYTALERTLFLGEPDKVSLKMWEANVAVHELGNKLIKPGVKCSDIAEELNVRFQN
eukprot:GSMAST32.ASY1.ANO1.2749.1 assembled CDS